MSSKFGKPEKLKGRFAQSNINLVFKGNANEIQSKPTLRSGGFQLVGKLQGTRRHPPPPPWVPSIKAEMGGQSARVNIVPPGGSGWGTGPANTQTNDAGSSNNFPDPKSLTTSILKDITKPPENANDDPTTSDLSRTSLVKPPQKPFFAMRSSQTGAIKGDGLSESTRHLASRNVGPTVPFYQRSSSSHANPSKDIPIDEISPKPTEKQDSRPVTRSSSPHTGWAAVTTEEPDFQERVNFSDDDDDVDAKLKPPIEPPKEVHPVPGKSWNSAPIQPPRQFPISSYPRAAWDQPASCFGSAPPLPHPFSVPFGVANETGYPGAASTIPVVPATALSARNQIVQEHSRRPTFVNTEERVQREERFLAYKTAVSKSQMTRKKQSAEMDATETHQKDKSSLDSPDSNLTEVGIFSQSFMRPGVPVSVPSGSPFHAVVCHSSQQRSHPPQVNMESLIAPMSALYSHGFSNAIPQVAPGSNQLHTSQMKQSRPTPSMSNPMLPPSWNSSSVQSNTRSQFQDQPFYRLSNSPKHSNDQDLFFNSEHLLMEPFNPQHQLTKSGYGVQEPLVGDSLGRANSPDVPNHTYTAAVGKSSTGPTGPSPRHASEVFTAAKMFEIDPLSDPVIQNRPHTVVVNGPQLRISAHADGTRTTFNPPISAPSASESVSTQPHITPLMEVDLSRKWNDKDFRPFPSPASRGGYAKSSHGIQRPTNADEKSSYNGNRHNRLPRDILKQPPQAAHEVVDVAVTVGDDEAVAERVEEESGLYETTDDQNLQRGGSCRRDRRRGAGGSSGTFPRRGRGSGRFTRSSRGAPADNEDCPQQPTCDSNYHRRAITQSAVLYNQQRDKPKGDRPSAYKGVSRRGNDHCFAVSASSRGGRGNFSRSAHQRRYGLEDDTKLSSESQNRKSRGHPCHRRCDEVYVHSNGAMKPDETDASLENEQSSKPEGGGVSHSVGGRGSRRGGSSSQRRGGNDGTHNTHRHSNNNNHRRHPDDGEGGGSAGGCGGGGCDRESGGNTNGQNSSGKTYQQSGDGGHGSGGTTTTEGTTKNGDGINYQQKDGEADATNEPPLIDTAATSSRPRRQAHSVTMTSDLETWETASEGLSSLLGTSSGAASFAESRPTTTVNADPAESLGFPSKQQVPFRPILTAEIVPLMSINAEAPASFSDNRCFLNSPPPRPSGDWKPSTKDFAADLVDAASVASSGEQLSEDGFMEVRSKSSKRQQKAKKQQLLQKSDEKVSKCNRDISKGPAVIFSKTTDHGKLASSSKACVKRDNESDKQQKQVPSSVIKKLASTPPPPPTNAWLKPLQETITEKAAAAAAVARASNSRPIKTVVVCSSSSVSVKSSAVASSMPSAYSWSVVVGSRNASTKSAIINGVEAKVDKLLQTAPRGTVVSEHQPTVSPPAAAETPNQHIPTTSQPTHDKTNSRIHTTTVGTNHFSDSAVSTTTPVSLANVCKVRPQKQPLSATASNCTLDVNISAPVTSGEPVGQPIANDKQDVSTAASSQSFKMAADNASLDIYSNPVALQPPPAMYRRQQFGGTEWLAKASGSNGGNPVTSCSSFFDHYGAAAVAVQEFEHQFQQQPRHHHPDHSIGINTAAAAAAAIYMQQQQQHHNPQTQPFGGQRFQPPPQPMMGFGLSDLSAGVQAPRSQLGMNTENYYAQPMPAAPFATNQPTNGGSRGLYPPPPQQHQVQPSQSQQRGFLSSWQQHQQSANEAVAMAAAAAAGLWPSPTYTPPPHHPTAPAPPYVGVIGADRPGVVAAAAAAAASRANTSGVAGAHHHQHQASLYNVAGGSFLRGGGSSVGMPFGGGNQPPHNMQATPPGGLYASSPTPPPHAFDPCFSFNSGIGNSNMFSHQHGSMLPPQHHRHQGAVGSRNRSALAGDPSQAYHPHHPPVFINSPAAAFPAASALPMSGLGAAVGNSNVSMAAHGIQF